MLTLTQQIMTEVWRLSEELAGCHELRRMARVVAEEAFAQQMADAALDDMRVLGIVNDVRRALVYALAVRDREGEIPQLGIAGERLYAMRKELFRAVAQKLAEMEWMRLYLDARTDAQGADEQGAVVLRMPVCETVH